MRVDCERDTELVDRKARHATCVEFAESTSTTRAAPAGSVARAGNCVFGGVWRTCGSRASAGDVASARSQRGPQHERSRTTRSRWVIRADGSRYRAESACAARLRTAPGVGAPFLTGSHAIRATVRCMRPASMRQCMALLCFRWNASAHGSVVTLERLHRFSGMWRRPAQGARCLHAWNRWSHCHGTSRCSRPL